MGKFRRLSLLLTILGISAIVYAISPIVYFELRYAPLLAKGSLTSPTPDLLAVSILNLSSTDYTKASNWFPTVATPDHKTVSSYTLSIPKLGIRDALVSTVSDDLLKSLVHYSGSSLPGQKGNAVIFGHSTLPQFFNPKNYKSIFSTLHTLKVGDTVTVTFDGVLYQYAILAITVVDPKDVSVLEQQYDASSITIITCTPPGTYWKRLVIKGNLDRLSAT